MMTKLQTMSLWVNPLKWDWKSNPNPIGKIGLQSRSKSENKIGLTKSKSKSDPLKILAKTLNVGLNLQTFGMAKNFCSRIGSLS